MLCTFPISKNVHDEMQNESGLSLDFQGTFLLNSKSLTKNTLGVREQARHETI